MNRVFSFGSLALVLAVGCAHDEVKPTATAAPPVAEKVVAEPAAPALVPDPWQDKSTLFVAPSMTPTTKVNLGPIERFTLPNGLKVIVVARHDVPAVDLSIAVKVGHWQDPLDRVGLAEFTAGMLKKGTKKRSADQISEAIEAVGGVMEAGVDNRSSFVGCQVRSKDLPLCLDLVSDVVEHAAFPESEMGQERDQLDAAVEGTKDSPPDLARHNAMNLYFGDNDIRGRFPSKRSIHAIDRTQLAAFFAKWYAPNNAVLAISGDVDAKAVRAQLQRAFAGWKRHDVPKIAHMSLPAAPPKMKVRLVDKPDATQSQIAIVGPGLAHADADYPATRLMDFSLGSGVFSSRLMKVVRSQAGKTYGARTTFEVGRDPGPFLATTFTRNAETGATIKLVLAEAARMQKGGPTAEELAAAKGNMIGGFGLTLETGGDVARTLLTAELDGLPDNFVESYLDRLNEVTVAQAAAAAAAHLAPDTLVVLGKASEIKPNLEKAGFEVGEVVDYAEPVSAAERKLLADEKKVAGDVDPKAAASGAALLEAATRAAGGVAALHKIHQLKIAASGTLSMQGQAMPINVVMYDVPGQARRVEMNIGPMKIVQAVSDKGAFIQQGTETKDLPPAMAAGIRRELDREPNVIFSRGTGAGAKVRGLPQAADGDAHFDVLEVISPAGDATQLWLDPKSHLVSRVVFKEDEKQTREDFSDYRAHEGVQFAHKNVRTGGQGEKIDIVYDKVEINPGFATTLFSH